MAAKLPIGIQGFEGLRRDGFTYVDKTALIHRLVHEGMPYFLSRPRRFGKSLLLSTMKAYWQGKRELFEGLAIETLEKNNPNAWKEYPVFHLDFNGENYEMVSIEEVLDQHLSEWEEIYGDQYRSGMLGFRFEKLLEAAAQEKGSRCVVLVDEYDKPLLETIEDPKREDHIKKVLKGFFSRLKKADEHIQFIFITGVSNFHKVSIFSDLNQMNDISLDEDYACLCGITENEILHYADEEIDALCQRRKLTRVDALRNLKKQYDGYHFSSDSEGVYNPYSLLKCFFSKNFGSYWFETGTPTFLIEQLRKSQFDVHSFSDQTIFASEAVLKDYTGDSLDPVPLLYQTGYLTITAYDEGRKRYTLGFPNEEVKYGFLESMMPVYVPTATSGNKLDIFTLDEYVEAGNLDRIRDFFTALFANITYTKTTDPFEHDFQTVIQVVFLLLGKLTNCEVHTYIGRIDCKVETKNYIYLFEFKRDEVC